MLARIDHDELDSGRGRADAERLCVVTRRVRPVSELIRFVVGPGGEIVPDLKKNLPGRGVWVTATRDALAEAIRRNAFAKSFKRDVKLPAGLVDTTQKLLERAALDGLSIAHKAGLLVTGFAKVEAALGRERVAALVHASDAGADGVRKLNAAMHRESDEKSGNLAVVSLFTGEQLDLALGRPNVVHAALLAGPESHRFLARYARLTHFGAGDLASPASQTCTER